ncbi:MAG: P-loop NTPase [Archaeoglobaceae archaeon]
MKILICGKGGSGKSVIATLLAKGLAKRNFRVLLLDADESNHSLARNFGVSEIKQLIEFLGGKKDVRDRLLRFIQSGGKEKAKLFDEISLKEIPKDLVIEKDGVILLATGKIQDFGEGCACPMGFVTKEFLGALKLENGDFVVVDAEAGVEHFGRGIEANCDLILIVIEPSYDSLKLAEKIKDMCKPIGKKVIVVANKFDDEYRNLLKADVFIPFKKEIFEACLHGREIPLIEEVGELVDAVLR